MDAKITKTRLSRMLSYDWLKIVGAIAGFILVWSLIFTMTATRITPAQQFHVLNYVGNYSWSTSFGNFYKGAKEELSYEVMEIHSEDLSTNEDYLTTLMEARLATYEADVMFVADIDDPDTAYEDATTGETLYKHTYLETFIVRYGSYLYNLSDPTVDETSYFKQMENYLNLYYKGDWTNAENLNEAQVEKDFRARVKKNKDKRYKKESQILAGIEKDIGRIEKYRDGLEKFYQYVKDGYIAYNPIEFTYERKDNTPLEYKGKGYTLNICPNEKMEALKDYVGYYKTETDEEGNEMPVKRAENMNVAFFDAGKEMEEGFQYENVLFINYVVEQCIEEEK